MTRTEQIEQMISYYTKGNKSKFAKMIGLAPQTISGWCTRDTMDFEQVYAKCVGISAEWLLSGEGEMIRKPLSDDSEQWYKSIIQQQGQTIQAQGQTIQQQGQTILSQQEEISHRGRQLDNLVSLLKKEVAPQEGNATCAAAG